MSKRVKTWLWAAVVSAVAFVMALVSNIAIVKYTDGFLDQSWQALVFYVSKGAMLPLGIVTAFCLVVFLIGKWGDCKNVSAK